MRPMLLLAECCFTNRSAITTISFAIGPPTPRLSEEGPCGVAVVVELWNLAGLTTASPTRYCSVQLANRS